MNPEFFKKHCIGYNVVLISTVQQSDCYRHINIYSIYFYL